MMDRLATFLLCSNRAKGAWPALFGLALLSCTIANKGGPGDLGASAGGGGTSTGNAGVRFVPYQPHIFQGGTQSITVSILGVALQVASSGNWLELPFSRSNLVVQPTGKKLIDMSELPAGDYTGLKLNLNMIQVKNTSGERSSYGRYEMVFAGNFTIGQGESVGLEPQAYADATAGVTTTSQLANAWNSTSASIGAGSGPNHVLFVTSVDVAANSGIDSMDVTCETQAALGVSLGNLPDGREWLAVVSTSLEDARDRFVLEGDVYNSNESGFERIATSAGFWNASTLWEAGHGYDPSGAHLTGVYVWTGSTPNGLVSPNNACNDWASTDPALTGSAGSLNSAGPARLSNGPAICSLQNRLYCLSQ